MPHSTQSDAAASRKDNWFTTTQWSFVLEARDPNSPQAFQALETLCRTYWHPLYAFARSLGHDEETAKDLIQGFFARLLERHSLRSADPEKGKFRSFLLTGLRNFLSDEWDRARAQKRGGGTVFISLDDENAEERFRVEPTDDMSPDRLFDRHWALTVLDQAAERLREEYEKAGQIALFEQLRGFLSGKMGGGCYAETASCLELPENTLKSLVHRLRHRYRERLREVIADTVATPAEVDEEIRHLLDALAA